MPYSFLAVICQARLAYNCFWIRDLQSLSLVVAQVGNLVLALAPDVGWACSWTMSLLFVFVFVVVISPLSSSIMYFYDLQRSSCNRCFAPSITSLPESVENIFKWSLSAPLVLTLKKCFGCSNIKRKFVSSICDKIIGLLIQFNCSKNFIIFYYDIVSYILVVPVWKKNILNYFIHVNLLFC